MVTKCRVIQLDYCSGIGMVLVLVYICWNLTSQLKKLTDASFV